MADKPNVILVADIPGGNNSHHLKILQWDDDVVSDAFATITMIFPTKEDPHAPEFMPLQVETTGDDDVCRLLWKRDWNYGFPYLAYVGDEVVIVIWRNDEIIDVLAIRDMLLGKARETTEMIALKRATAQVLGNAVIRLTAHEREVEAWLPEVRATAVVAASTSVPVSTPSQGEVAAKVVDVAVVRPNQESTNAVPRIPASTGSTKVDQLAKHRAEIAKRRPIIVYDKRMGTRLVGIPVAENELMLLQDEQCYVGTNRSGIPVDHFKVEAEEGKRPRRKDVVLVTTEPPVSRPDKGGNPRVMH